MFSIIRSKEYLGTFVNMISLKLFCSGMISESKLINKFMVFLKNCHSTFEKGWVYLKMQKKISKNKRSKGIKKKMKR